MEEETDDRFDGAWVPTELIAMLSELGLRDLHRYFSCVMLAQGAINDDMRTLLMRESVSLVCLKRTRTRIKTEWCEGELRTDFASATLEHIAGVKFECTVDVGRRTTKATFIITSSFLDQFEAASWLSRQQNDVKLKTDVFN